MINNNNNISIDKATDRLVKKWKHEDPPKDTDDCLICGENFPMMPHSSIPLGCYTSQEIWTNRQNFLRSGYKRSIYDDDEEFWSKIKNIDDLIHTYMCYGNLCKYCFLELDQWIQEKQKQYNWK